MKVSIIIPNYNGLDLLKKNLPVVIEESRNKENKIGEIIIVDDGSTDESVNYLKQLDVVKLIKHTKNRGFSASINTGVRASKENLILLLNSDVCPKKNFLVSALKVIDQEKVFSVSLHETGYGYSKANFKDGYLSLVMGDEEKTPHQSFYVSGGSALFKKDIWKEIGGMDEKMFSPFYWEDIDLSFRAMKRGYLNMWDPDSRVIHNHESTVSKLEKKKVNMIRERNELLFTWKNIHSKAYFRKHISAMFLRGLRHIGYFKVVFLALSKLSLVLRERRKEIKQSIVSDEAIFARFS